LNDYPFSSYLSAIGKRKEATCDYSFLRSLGPSPERYKEFVTAGTSDLKEELLENLTIEGLFDE
jgi:hypothetical protein